MPQCLLAVLQRWSLLRLPSTILGLEEMVGMRDRARRVLSQIVWQHLHMLLFVLSISVVGAPLVRLYETCAGWLENNLVLESVGQRQGTEVLFLFSHGHCGVCWRSLGLSPKFCDAPCQFAQW